MFLSTNFALILLAETFKQEPKFQITDTDRSKYTIQLLFLYSLFFMNEYLYALYLVLFVNYVVLFWTFADPAPPPPASRGLVWNSCSFSTLYIVTYTPRASGIYAKDFKYSLWKLYEWKMKNPSKSCHPFYWVHRFYGMQNDWLNLTIIGAEKKSESDSLLPELPGVPKKNVPQNPKR